MNRRSIVAGNWVIAERGPPGEWVNILAVPLTGKGRYHFGWNGERLSAAAENLRFEKHYPGQLVWLVEVLERHFPPRHDEGAEL